MKKKPLKASKNSIFVQIIAEIKNIYNEILRLLLVQRSTKNVISFSFFAYASLVYLAFSEVYFLCILWVFRLDLLASRARERKPLFQAKLYIFQAQLVAIVPLAMP